MKAIQLERNQTGRPEIKTLNFSPATLLRKYLEYAATQESLRIFWYMKVLIIIPCCIMVPTIMLMKFTIPDFIWFITLSIILFFTNIMVHITELKSTITVPVYHLSIAVMILIPSINYLLNL